MAFPTEKTGYLKTILSDLEGAWEVLRQSVAEEPGMNAQDRLLFHIDEAMSWENGKEPGSQAAAVADHP
jgi:hypothetical protein